MTAGCTHSDPLMQGSEAPIILAFTEALCSQCLTSANSGVLCLHQALIESSNSWPAAFTNPPLPLVQGRFVKRSELEEHASMLVPGGIMGPDSPAASVGSVDSLFN